MSDSIPPTPPQPANSGGPVKLPPLKLPPKPVPSAPAASAGDGATPAPSSPPVPPTPLKPPMPPMPPIPGAGGAASGAPTPLAPLRPPTGVKPPGDAASVAVKPPIPGMAVSAPPLAPISPLKPSVPAAPAAPASLVPPSVKAVTPDATAPAEPSAPSGSPVPAALKPQPVAQPALAKPMPQATIKLQVAPKPAASTATRKADTAQPDSTDKNLDGTDDKASSKSTEVSLGDEVQNTAPGVPLVFVIAAAAMAFVAFLIQIWTFIS